MAPKARISADVGFDAVFVAGGVLFTDSVPVRTILISADDRMLIQKRDPVVWNEGRKQKGMRSSALGTADTADPERTDTVRKKDAPRIVSMDSQAGRMSAGTFQPVKLEAVNDGIVIIL